MHELDTLVSRYRELRGKPVLKRDAHLLARIEAYMEMMDDLRDMADRKERMAGRKRVHGQAKKLQSKLIGECAACGLDLQEELARASKAKQS